MDNHLVLVYIFQIFHLFSNTSFSFPTTPSVAANCLTLIFQYHLYKVIVWLMPLYNVPACNLAFFGVSHVERLNSCYSKRKYGYHILVNLLVFQCILREQNTDWICK